MTLALERKQKQWRIKSNGIDWKPHHHGWTPSKWGGLQVNRARTWNWVDPFKLESKIITGPGLTGFAWFVLQNRYETDSTIAFPNLKMEGNGTNWTNCIVNKKKSAEGWKILQLEKRFHIHIIITHFDTLRRTAKQRKENIDAPSASAHFNIWSILRPYWRLIWVAKERKRGSQQLTRQQSGRRTREIGSKRRRRKPRTGQIGR